MIVRRLIVKGTSTNNVETVQDKGFITNTFSHVIELENGITQLCIYFGNELGINFTLPTQELQSSALRNAITEAQKNPSTITMHYTKDEADKYGNLIITSDDTILYRTNGGYED